MPRLQPTQLDVLSAPWDGEGFALRGDARRFETSEVSVALLAGLANALEECNDLGLAKIRQRIDTLSQQVREQLKTIPGLELHNLGPTEHQSGLIAFTLKGWDSVELKQRLAQHGINIGANGVAYTPLDMRARRLESIARIALSYLNTEEEIEVLLGILRKLTDVGGD